VILDPTMCLGEGSSGEGCTGNNESSTNLDTFVFNDGVDNWEEGWTVIRTGYDVRTDDSVYGAMRSILYFPPAALPDGAVIYDTDLQTRIYSLFGSAQGEVISAYRLTKQLTSHVRRRRRQSDIPARRPPLDAVLQIGRRIQTQVLDGTGIFIRTGEGFKAWWEP
jgi:hypothetical protein